ncbi:23S rRNA pseudouridine2605 synthase [Thermosulfidibacter takaii ABI70S6]|uniref:Pseudouridine synthase n=1 Tax=Thermosulfidibacter takaii (strain DSM 17441 / JCM 13301 / NBRC 103674 / ABI70S6) TaxID=1298851 RepID=A0A0S3QVW0_THET7|nr:pseudouridine synthase [Thermosulfidibacter takaii]BAT72462.1 23S rRNA pseudouridine2605 synthase [Thermosulfidibacter takaii ABI70S6]
MEEKLRLNKFLAECGLGARRKVERLIDEGKVAVNGIVVKEYGFRVDPGKDIVTVDGRVVEIQPKVYIAFNKPRNILTTMKDERGRLTVYDVLPIKDLRVFPVGRLDRASRGLLLLTNDGELAYRLLHPKYHVPKRYIVTVEGSPPEEKLNKLRRGIYLYPEGKTLPCEIRVIDRQKWHTKLEVILKEGRKRQIRRMFKKIGYPVKDLIRVAVGPITLKGLPEGHYRYLTGEEVNTLKEMVGLKGSRR